MAARTITSIVLEQRFRGHWLNTGAMPDLPNLAATLLAIFATVRIPASPGLRARPVAALPPRLRPSLLSMAVAGESLILGCHRQWLHSCLLEQGHRAFFDRIEGGGPDGWRLDFFCLDPSALSVLRDADVGEFGPGDPSRFNPEAFVLRRLRQMERTGHLGRPDEWWDWDSWIG
jgi:hypothetical protein